MPPEVGKKSSVSSCQFQLEKGGTSKTLLTLRNVSAWWTRLRGFAFAEIHENLSSEEVSGMQPKNHFMCRPLLMTSFALFLLIWAFAHSKV
jgi:hypothetical protein